jgi:Tfp pilus assembly protein PilN
MSGRWPAPDFVRTSRPVPWVSWVMLLVGAAVLVLAFQETVALQAEVEMDRAEVAKLERRLRATAQPRVLGAASAQPATISLEGARALRRTEAQLQQAWDRAFLGLEQATVPGVRWLALEIEASSNRLRAEGIASDVDAVLAVVDSMASRSGWSEVVLNRMQLADAAGAATQRFEIAARWGAPSPVEPLPGRSR